MIHVFRASLFLLWASPLGAAVSPLRRVAGRTVLADNGRPRQTGPDGVVWIESTRREAGPKDRNPGKPKAPAPPTMTSSHKKFVPRVVAVSAGEAVSFPNEDPIFHNVFSV